MLKNILHIFVFCIFMSSCSKDMETKNIGFLNINGINIVNNNIDTKTLNENEDFVVTIYNEDNTIIKTYSSYLDIVNNKETIRLFEGRYYIEARSKDVPLSGLNCPAYKGKSKIFTIERGTTSEVSIMCKLDGIAISFIIPENFNEIFTNFNIQITPAFGNDIVFNKNNINDVAYMSINSKTISYIINATNIKEESFTIEKRINIENSHKYEVKINL